MSRPWNIDRPPVGSISLRMQRAIVDLPQPDSPTTPSVSPSLSDEVDAVDGLHGGDLLLEDDPSRDGEVLLQPLDAQELVGHRHLPAVPASTAALRRAASRLFVSSSRKHACRCA